jgi:hypothetical protein
MPTLKRVVKDAGSAAAAPPDAAGAFEAIIECREEVGS